MTEYEARTVCKHYKFRSLGCRECDAEKALASRTEVEKERDRLKEVLWNLRARYVRWIEDGEPFDVKAAIEEMDLINKGLRPNG